MRNTPTPEVWTYLPYPDGLDTSCQHCGGVPVLHTAGTCPFPAATLTRLQHWRRTGHWPCEEDDTDA